MNEEIECGDVSHKRCIGAYVGFLFGAVFASLFCVVPIMFVASLLSRCLPFTVMPVFRVLSSIASLIIGYFIFRGVLKSFLKEHKKSETESRQHSSPTPHNGEGNHHG